MLQKIKGIFQSDEDAELQKEAGKLLSTLSAGDKEALMRQLIKDMAEGDGTQAQTPEAIAQAAAQAAVAAAAGAAGAGAAGEAAAAGAGAAGSNGPAKIDMNNPEQVMSAFQQFLQAQGQPATKVGNAGAPANTASAGTVTPGSKDHVIAIANDPEAFRKDFYGDNSVVKQYLKSLGGS